MDHSTELQNKKKKRKLSETNDNDNDNNNDNENNQMNGDKLNQNQSQSQSQNDEIKTEDSENNEETPLRKRRRSNFTSPGENAMNTSLTYKDFNQSKEIIDKTDKLINQWKNGNIPISHGLSKLTMTHLPPDDENDNVPRSEIIVQTDV